MQRGEAPMVQARIRAHPVRHFGFPVLNCRLPESKPPSRTEAALSAYAVRLVAVELFRFLNLGT